MRAILPARRTDMAETVERAQTSLRQRDGPETLIVCIDSRRKSARAALRRLQPHFRKATAVVADEAFDAQFGRRLITSGVEEYLDAAHLTAQQIRWRIDQATLRRQRSAALPHGANAGQGDESRLSAVILGLPRRQRQVLELLSAGLAPKQIASKLGTRQQTVRNQIATLREKFGVQSPQQLIVAALRTRFREAAQSG